MLYKATATRSKLGHATQPSTYGPTSAAGLLPRLVPQLTSDSGIMKRFSVAGWGSGTSSPTASIVETSRNSGEYDIRRRDSVVSANPPLDKPTEPSTPVVQPQSTGGLWSSWWSSSGGEKSLASGAPKQVEKTAKWFADGIRNGRSTDSKLVKHLIALRVHLSTANLVWIEDFMDVEKGMGALSKLLSTLVGKGGKRKKLTDIEDTVLLEVIKCLRVLLNTEVSRSLSVDVGRLTQ